MAQLKFTVITIFPDLLEPFCNKGVFGRSIQNGILEVNTVNPREFVPDHIKGVDDIPYGGGAGMVFKPLPLYKALKHAKKSNKGKVVFLTPSGKTFDNTTAAGFAREEELILLCGRYEGIDQRIIDLFVDEEVSVGNYVLSGGEPAAICVMDAVSRHIKGVVKEFESVENDSFYNGLLDHPHYTRPEVFNGMKVPEVLLSGNHKRIHQWREKMKLLETLTKKPELLSDVTLTRDQQKILKEIKEDLNKLR